jgi:uncharacterized membrane protein HdeD (DUF308 family)
MTQPSTSQRPLGITILAILAAVAGVFGLLAGFGMMALFGAGGLFMILGLVTLVVSVLYLAFAYGAWTLQSWGWTLGVGLSIVSIVITLLQLTQGMTNIVSAIISIAISGAILYYLYQPAVKGAFGRP